jgi:hypothetical protein
MVEGLEMTKMTREFRRWQPIGGQSEVAVPEISGDGDYGMTMQH